MLKFLKKLFKKIFEFLKKILAFLKDILPILIVLAIVFFPAVSAALSSFLPASMVSALGSFELWTAGLTAWELTALSLGTAAVLAPDETGKILGSMVDNIGEVAQDVVQNSTGLIDAAVSLAGGIASSIFGALPTWVWVAAVGVGLFWLTSSNDEQVIVVGRDDEHEKEYSNGSAL